MSDMSKLDLVRAAAAGFAEGLLRVTECTCRVRVDDDGGSGDEPASSGDMGRDAERNETPGDWHSDSYANEWPAGEEDLRSKVSPEELAAAMSAMTQRVPDGMYDPEDDSELRPRFLAP